MLNTFPGEETQTSGESVHPRPLQAYETALFTILEKCCLVWFQIQKKHLSFVPLHFEYSRGKNQTTMKTCIVSLSEEPFTYLNPFNLTLKSTNLCVCAVEESSQHLYRYLIAKGCQRLGGILMRVAAASCQEEPTEVIWAGEETPKAVPASDWRDCTTHLALEH